MRKKTKIAFTLLEMSFVIIIISILVIAATKGAKVFKEAKLKSARALTASSTVNASDGLVLWLETTSDKSFDYPIKDGDKISTWYDINPQNPNKHNATQSTQDRKPEFNETNFNLPVVEFTDGGDGVGDNSLSLSTEVWKAKKGTIFIVSAVGKGITTPNNTLFHFSDGTEDGYGASSPFYEFHAHYTGQQYGTYAADSVTGSSNNFTIAASTFGSVNIYDLSILTITANPGVAFEFFINGGTAAKTSTLSTVGNDQNQILYATLGSMTNTSSTRKLFGYIGEVIIFNRVLSAPKIAAINKYLSQKWGMRVN